MSVNPTTEGPSSQGGISGDFGGISDSSSNDYGYDLYQTSVYEVIYNEAYKSYFAQNGGLHALGDRANILLDQLKNAINADEPNETEITELKDALDALLGRNDETKMGLSDRVSAYETLVKLKNNGEITDEDFDVLLEHLNSTRSLSKEEYGKLLAIARYNGCRSTYINLINDENYKDYLDGKGALKDLGDALKEALNNLENALDEIYDEAVIDAAIKALTELLIGNTSLMGLVARIEAYVNLVELKNNGEITDEDFDVLLEHLNSKENLPKEDYDKLLTIAKRRQKNLDAVAKLSDLDKNEREALESAIKKDSLDTIAKYSDEDIGYYYGANAEDNVAHFRLKNPSHAELNIDAVTAKSKLLQIGQSASLSMKVIQANNAYRDLESQLEAESSLDDRAKFDEKLKRLREQGIWADNMTSNRRQEILQEDEKMKALDAERRAKN